MLWAWVGVPGYRSRQVATPRDLQEEVSVLDGHLPEGLPHVAHVLEAAEAREDGTAAALALRTGHYQALPCINNIIKVTSKAFATGSQDSAYHLNESRAMQEFGPRAFIASWSFALVSFARASRGARASDRAAGCPWGVPWGRGARVEVRRVWCMGVVVPMAAGGMGPRAFAASCSFALVSFARASGGAGASDRAAGCPWGVP